MHDPMGRDVIIWHPYIFLPLIDLSPYPAGTYLVRINFNRGVSVTRKVVKTE